MSLKPHPLLLMLALLGLAAAAAFWLQPGRARDEGQPLSQTRLLEGQVEYLQGQLEALQEENQRLSQLLAKLENRPPADPPNSPPFDAVGLSLKFMQLRQLPAVPMPCRSVPMAKLESLILAWLQARLPAATAQARMQAWQAMGWVEQAANPLPLQAALLARSLGGWYQPQEQSLWIAQDSSGSIDPSLACALAPQLRQLATPSAAQPASSDLLMAQLGTLLGDAAYCRNRLELEQPQALPQTALPLEDPDHPFNSVEAPHLLREFTLQPMLWGLRRAQRIQEQGGWPALNASSLQAPGSCARLRDWPLSSAPSLVASPPPAGLRSTSQDQLGALTLNCLLRTEISDADADALSRGWIDDRLSLHPSDQDLPQACWRVQLQSPAQAAACAKAAARIILRRPQAHLLREADKRQEFQIGTRHAAVCWQESPPLLIWAEGAQAAFVNQALPATGTGQR